MQIRSVQGLRALAALYVVGFHATVLWHDKFDPAGLRWENGNSGVDLFFVISGFIMALSSRSLIGVADGWRQFITLRLVRIVPMYWLATIAKLAAIVAVPALALHSRPTPWNIAASFLFIPARDASGVVRPVLDVGWTLSFEMLFYLAFAAALFLARDPLAVVAPVMAALALSSLLLQPTWPAVTTLADPVVLEFVLGVAAARLLLARRRAVSAPVCLAMLAAGLACLTLIPADGRWQRVSIWGVAATIALSGSVLGERFLSRVLPDVAVFIGESSYSLYLTHGFVLPVVGLVVAKSGLHGQLQFASLVAACIAGSVMIAAGAYAFVEKPMTDRLRHAVRARGRSALAVPESPL